MNPIPYHFTRRRFLSQTGSGFGQMALSDLLGRNSAQAAVMPSGGALGGTHFAPKAKRVIYLFQSGGPSHLDLFDDKPTLADMHGTDIPASVLGTQRVLLMTRGYNVGAGYSRNACPVSCCDIRWIFGCRRAHESTGQ